MATLRLKKNKVNGETGNLIKSCRILICMIKIVFMFECNICNSKKTYQIVDIGGPH